ncbi:flagellar protein FlaG [Anaerobacterium chartisolvens]|uniref:Flagellar protein FlaG n=1 Tax=Anaerobacterium chartisolvens TaxID=1297424 RepID=A0A369B041_9FIRM|nr:flagellar protein FlaG [Anaerobacterium chartisolvens]RCX14783.1 flagellar protein FlaG [Anaerobacterium chartisolvens]
MKIDGIEAPPAVVVKRAPEPKADAKVNTQVPVIDTALEGKSISQMTDYDKSELTLSERVVIEAIEKANRAITGPNMKFEFSIHEKTKAIMVKVLNSESNEVIREIPPEKILDMVAKMWELAGIIVDERR